MEVNEAYMERALQLAALGRGWASPNPMVGAVIVRDGKIIGEGYHRRFGGPHAEVNAINSVVDKRLLRDATMYVTLEPCAHYGKTPPCANLIVETGVPRVVIGCVDPFAKVSGRGVEILRDAGVEVVLPVLEKECLQLNEKFMTAHKLGRPFVTLKWAQSADGYTDSCRVSGEPAQRFSTSLSSVAVHALRADCDVIITGAGTVLSDNPSLDVRLVEGRSPRVAIIDRRGRVGADASVFGRAGVIYFSVAYRADLPDSVEQVVLPLDGGLDTVLRYLYAHGAISVMVEAGATLQKEFITRGLWDKARVEIAPFALGDRGVGRMTLPEGIVRVESLDGNEIVNIERLAM